MQHVPAQPSSQVTLRKEMAHACSLCTHYSSYKSCWAVHGSSGVHVKFREAKKYFYSMYFFGLSNVHCALEIMFIIIYLFFSYDIMISFYILKLAQHYKFVLFYLVILILFFSNYSI